MSGVRAHSPVPLDESRHHWVVGHQGQQSVRPLALGHPAAERAARPDVLAKTICQPSRTYIAAVRCELLAHSIRTVNGGITRPESAPINTAGRGRSCSCNRNQIHTGGSGTACGQNFDWGSIHAD